MTQLPRKGCDLRGWGGVEQADERGQGKRADHFLRLDGPPACDLDRSDHATFVEDPSHARARRMFCSPHAMPSLSAMAP